MLLMTLCIENNIRAADSMEISRPLRGRAAMLDPKPMAAAMPIPHEVHPGAAIPKKTPIDATNPTFLPLKPICSNL